MSRKPRIDQILSNDIASKLLNKVYDLSFEKIKASVIDNSPIIRAEILMSEIRKKAVDEIIEPEVVRLNTLTQDLNLSKEDRVKIMAQVEQITDWVSYFTSPLNQKDWKDYLSGKENIEVATKQYLKETLDLIRAKYPLNSINNVQREFKLRNAISEFSKCYPEFSDKDIAKLLQFFIQIKTRLFDLSSNDQNIMLCLYGKQGSGKTTLGEAISNVVQGEVKRHMLDELLGNFGTLDVFTAPIILFDEFGSRQKENLDKLKVLVDGGIIEVNRKYVNPVTGRCLSSFLLTTNTDPDLLKGAETGNRRILVIKMNNNRTFPDKTTVRKALEDMFRYIYVDDLEEFTGYNINNLTIDEYEIQKEETIEDFIISATEEQITSLETASKITVTSLMRIANIMAKQRAIEILSDTRYFTKHVSGRQTYYSADSNAIDAARRQ